MGTVGTGSDDFAIQAEQSVERHEIEITVEVSAVSDGARAQ